VWRAIHRVWRPLAEASAFDLALRLTLLDLLLRPVGDWSVRPFVLALAAAGLLVPGWLRRPGLWLLLTALTALRVILDWPLADNHAYLLAYWCLAVALSLHLSDTEVSLALNGRWLIGLVFAFATLAKVLSPDYLDGTFLRVTLLTDPRFEAASLLLGGLTPEALEEQRASLVEHIDGPALPAFEPPPRPPRFEALARLGTVWTLVLEAAIALAFLWPLGRGPSRLRDAALLLFCATTYALAPVAGFGWLLLAMGVAQCESDRRGTRLLYLTVYALILGYREIPWASLLAGAAIAVT
jgi:hypothetical protein